MDTVKKYFNKIEEILVVPMLVVMSVTIILQVIFRYVVKGSLPWSEELARYFMVWVTFLGASIGVKRGAHVGVEALVMILPKNAQTLVRYLVIIISVAFCCLVFFVSLVIIKTQFVNNQISPAMRIPMWLAYGAIPTGTFFMTVRFVQVFIQTVHQNKAVKAEGRG